MAKSKKNKNKAKLNLTVRDEQRNKLEQMASLENRSVSNLIEVMADERWKRLAEQQGVAYAKTVAEAMKLLEQNPEVARIHRRAPFGRDDAAFGFDDLGIEAQIANAICL